MNYALSQRRTDRHPVGLMIVVGLHVLLAGALLSAKLQSSGPTEVVPIPVLPPEVPKPVVQRTTDLPQPPAHTLKQLVVPIPTLESDRPDTIVVPRHDEQPAETTEPTIIIAKVDVPRDVPRATPHRGSLNAAAAQCRPDYPAAAQRLGVTGTSRIRFSVDAAGRVLGAQILQSSGPSRENRLMDQAAAAALARCPVTLGNDDQGRAVPFTTDVDYVWALN